MDDVDRELPILQFDWTDQPPAAEELLAREWLVTNGLGSYASSTLAQCNSRRYHGLFIPSLPAPHGRTVLLPRLSEHVEMDGGWHRIDAEESLDGRADMSGAELLRSFRLHGLIPEWEYQLGPLRLRRKLTLVHGENTLFVAYEHLAGPAARLRLRPFPAFRYHDQPIPVPGATPAVWIQGDRLELRSTDDAPPLRFRVYSGCASPFVSLAETSPVLCYRIERARGLDHTETQHSPGYFECTLNPGASLTLGVTVETFEALDRRPDDVFALERERERRLLQRVPPEHRAGTTGRLVLAADQYIIDPVTRPQDDAWARATGQDARSVIAGYHWFTDWGRDTMISLEGLALCTGRLREAAAILRTFRHYVRDGLIPNMFPEGGREGLYHTADATLWFFHAIDRFAEHAGDLDLVREFFPTLEEIVARHLRGTHFGIGIDPEDGLLRQGQQGYQLTWMDAKVGDWVVTPRRGKAVELNALWFNALRLMADWAQAIGKDPTPYLSHAEKTHVSFNRRFWNEDEQCLFDVVDGESGDDPAIRPNQVFAISLRHPALVRERWEPVLRKVEVDLLTPVGLRSLSPSHAEYRAFYDGDLRARDAAYHQGTVWAWLIGHYVDARMKLDGGADGARDTLRGLEDHLTSAGVGQLSEIFDATAPYRPRGCIAQAWSVAELLRVSMKTRGR